MQFKRYNHKDDLSEVFVGRRIVDVQLSVDIPEVEQYDDDYDETVVKPVVWGTNTAGLLTLDNGQKVYLVGHEGGCSCIAGDYHLTRLASIDNIITSVKVVNKEVPNEEPEDPDDCSIYYDIRETYSIFVITNAEELNVAEFEGTDGNGYYGTGFHLAVMPV